MKRWMPLLCIAFVATSFLGASAWEGSAMMSAYGEFPDSGYYAACNSFPRNTAVEVVNLENGKTVTVIITKGLENPGIFLLLSPEAAKVLSMEPGALSRVRVSAPRNIAQTPPPGSGPVGDPDFNPSLLAARAGTYAPPPESSEPTTGDTAIVEPPAREPELERAAEIVVVAEPEGEQPLPEEPGRPELPDSDSADDPRPGKLDLKETPVVRPEMIARPTLTPSEPEPFAASLPAPEESKPVQVLEEKAVVHGLNRPNSTTLPVESVLVDPVLVPDELPEAALIRQAWPSNPEPRVALADLEIRMDESGRPEALSPSRAASIEPERSPKVGLEDPTVAVRDEPVKETGSESGESPESASSERTDVVVTLQPASPKPPETPSKPMAPYAPSAEPAAPVPAPVPAKEAPPVSTVLVPGASYIQIGAFKTSSSLETAAARLRGSFPVTIDTIKTGSAPLYRLFVGPLGRDETGVALLKIRSLGFKEAFLKN